jgi:hypothetical protein
LNQQRRSFIDRKEDIMLGSVSKIGLSLGIGIALLTSAGLARADVKAHSGTECMGMNSTEQAKLGYSAYGVQNNSTSRALVFCPIDTPQGSTVSGNLIQVKIYDRNSTAGGNTVANAGGNVVCQLDYMNQSGAAFVGGVGTVNAAANVNPTGFNLNFAVGPMWGATLYCSIPGSTPSGVSHLTSYHVQTTL